MYLISVIEAPKWKVKRYWGTKNFVQVPEICATMFLSGNECKGLLMPSICKIQKIVMLPKGQFFDAYIQISAFYFYPGYVNCYTLDIVVTRCSTSSTSLYLKIWTRFTLFEAPKISNIVFLI